MTFARSPFGDPAVNVASDVSNHYGTRASGGAQGKFRTAGMEYESVINFDSDGPIYDTQEIPLGAVVTDIRGYNLTGAIGAADVGAQDITLAQDDTDTTWVTIVTPANLVVTGPTGGNVIVKWRYSASKA